MSAFDLKVVHRAGSVNKVADCLSRNPISLQLDSNALRAAQSEIAIYNLKKPVVINGLNHVKFRGLTQLVVSPSTVSVFLKSLHDEKNHTGVDKILHMITGRFRWPQRDAAIRQFVRSCHACQESKPPNHSTLRPTHPIMTPQLPNKIWTTDAIVMVTAANYTSAKNILTVIDLHSRFVWAKPVKRLTKPQLASSELFDAIAPPEAILSDNGLNFTSNAVTSLLDKRGVKHLMTPPFRSQANGVVERVQGSIVTGLRTALVDHPQLRWSSLLRDVIQNINNLPHSSTGFTPRFLQFGLSKEPVNISVDDARRQAFERSRALQIKNLTLAKAVPHHLTLGQFVRYRIPENHPDRVSKLLVRFLAPCRFVGQLGQDTFTVEQLDPTNKQVIRSLTSHSSRLSPYESQDVTPDLSNESTPTPLAASDSPQNSEADPSASLSPAGTDAVRP